LAGIPVFLPRAFFWWWFLYDAYASSIFLEGAYIPASGGFVSIAVAIGMSVWREGDQGRRDLRFGSLGDDA